MQVRNEAQHGDAQKRNTAVLLLLLLVLSPSSSGTRSRPRTAGENTEVSRKGTRIRRLPIMPNGLFDIVLGTGGGDYGGDTVR